MINISLAVVARLPVLEDVAAHGRGGVTLPQGPPHRVHILLARYELLEGLDEDLGDPLLLPGAGDVHRGGALSRGKQERHPDSPVLPVHAPTIGVLCKVRTLIISVYDNPRQMYP